MCISCETEKTRGRIRTDYLEVKFGSYEGEVVREAGDVVGEPSNNYATHERAGYGSRENFMVKLSPSDEIPRDDDKAESHLL